MVSSCARFKGRNRLGSSRIRVDHVNPTQRNGHGHEVGQMQLVHQIDIGPLGNAVGSNGTRISTCSGHGVCLAAVLLSGR